MISSRAERDDYRAQDMARLDIDRWRWHYRITRRPLFFLRLLRQYEYLLGSGSRVRRPLLNVRLRRLGERLGYSIPPGTCGPGLSLPHHGTIVINDRARIGARATIFPGVTVGQRRGPEFTPVIGDDVTLSPNALVLGAVTVGDGAWVGAGAVLLRDVPPGGVAVGNPARLAGEHERNGRQGAVGQADVVPRAHR